MVSNSYKEAVTEVLEILEHTDKEEVAKIPQDFIDFLKSNKSETYVPNLDISKPIKELKLKPKTEDLLGMIYLKWWANEEEKEEFRKRAKENEKRYKEEILTKVDSDNLFKENKGQNKQEIKEDAPQETILPQVSKETFLQKIINKIRNIFRR